MPRAASRSASSVRRQLEEPEEPIAARGAAPAAHPLHRQPSGRYGLHRSAAHDEGALRCARSARRQRARRFLPSAHAGAHGGDAARGAAGRRSATTSSTSTATAPSCRSRRSARCASRKPDDGSGESKTDLVRADRLGDLLASYNIPLVVLEACRSAHGGKAAVFRSVAPRLIQAGVGSVLSMGHAVHVEAARLLLDRFYRELVRGTTIGQAVAEARSALHATPARWIEYGPGGAHHRAVRTGSCRISTSAARMTRSCRPTVAKQQPVRQFDLFLSHKHNDSARVEALARALTEKHGLRVWLDKWECGPGKLEPQCETGIRNSRFTVVAGSQTALSSKWVEWEIEKHHEFNPERARPPAARASSSRCDLPPNLDGLLWVDFTDPAEGRR